MWEKSRFLSLFKRDMKLGRDNYVQFSCRYQDGNDRVSRAICLHKVQKDLDIVFLVPKVIMEKAYDVRIGALQVT